MNKIPLSRLSECELWRLYRQATNEAKALSVEIEKRVKSKPWRQKKQR